MFETLRVNCTMSNGGLCLEAPDALKQINTFVIALQLKKHV